MPDPARDITRPLRILAVVLGVALALLAGLAWLNRKTLAREALTSWLESKGVPAEAEVEAFGLTTFTGSLRAGDPAAPDFAADRIHVRYRLGLGGLEVRSVTLTKPVLRARLRQGALHVGVLDPLIREFLSRPPRPDAAKPRIEIEDGVLALATDYGPVRLSADALVENAVLQRLTATSAPARLQGDGFDISLGPGALRAVTRAGRIGLTVSAPITSARAGGLDLREGRMSMVAHLPYPDLQKRRGDGAVVAAVTVTGAQAALGDQALDGVELKAALAGEATGWISDLSVQGEATASLQASAGRFGATRANAVRLAAVSEDFAWTRKGGDRVAGAVTLTGGAEGLTAGDLRIEALTAGFEGRALAGVGGVDLAFGGSAAGQGAWLGFGPVSEGDGASIAALKRAARSFRISAPALHLGMTRTGDQAPDIRFRMTAPVRLLARTGARVEMSSPTRLTVSGGGLPSADLRLANVRLGNRPSADVVLSASGLSAGPLVRGELSAAGRVRLSGDGGAFTATRCVRLQAPRLEFGANDVEEIAGRLCPVAGPMLSFADGAWRLAGRAEAVRGTVPFLQARIEGGAGSLRAGGRAGGAEATIRVDSARVEDTAPQTRFKPLAMAGDVALEGSVWRADLAFRRPDGPPVGTARLTHDGRSGVGGVTLDTGELVFAEGGLQPSELSPLAAAVGSPAVGRARFQGLFAWSPEGATSSGTLTIPRLDFQSPAGAVRGLSGEVAFESLAPLVAAPGQELRVEAVDAVMPLTKLHARFGLADQLLQVEGGEAEVGGGRVRVETLEIPLTPDAPIRGVLHLQGVQLHDLFEASPFGDKVDFDAVVSGRVPFEARGSRIRVMGGELRADRPGRISIDRTALAGVEAGGSIEGPGARVDPNATFTNFAYQAMENLAFNSLEATVMSRDDGRLGVLFHITGRHDPPKKQTLRLSLMDLIQRRFLGRNLPLPSGTGVNLTLDTSLNLDDLLEDYAEYRRARSSGPVQP